MRVLVAPDSFKGSLSSIELCQTIRHGMNNVMDAEVIEVPISDGGEVFFRKHLFCASIPSGVGKRQRSVGGNDSRKNGV